MGRDDARILLQVASMVTLLAGCAGSIDLPPSLRSQIDPTLTFAQLKETPETHRGRVLILGGEVLSARRLKDATRIEVLQLPLDRSETPLTDRTASQGRFLAFQREFFDPAVVPPGTRVTIVGEVIGAATERLDDAEYTYPTLEVKHLTVWPQGPAIVPVYPGPYAGPYWYSYPYWRYY